MEVRRLVCRFFLVISGGELFLQEVNQLDEKGSDDGS